MLSALVAQPMIKAVLFDFNATLIHSPDWMALETLTLPHAAFKLLADRGYIAPLSPDQLLEAEKVFQTDRQNANLTNRETSHVADLLTMVHSLGYQDKVPQSLVEETVAILHRNCIPNVALMAQAETTVKHLQSMGLRLGIISNAAYAPFLTWTLEHFRILDYFEEIVVSADVGSRKPGLEIFHITLARMGLKPPEAAYVGDDFHKDVVASKQLGLCAIWYRPEDGSSMPDGEPVPDAVVSGLGELPTLVERWTLT